MTVVLCVSLSASAAPRPQQRAAALVGAVERANRAAVGVSAIDLQTGERLVSLRADERFLPASNQKLLTSIFALRRLGPAFGFATGVLLDGNDLIVAGDGDPTLGDPVLAAQAGVSIYAELDRWAAAVRRQAGPQVRHLRLCRPGGRHGRHRDWPAEQKSKWYAAPVASLNFHDNCFDVTFVKVPGGLAPVVRPQSRLIRVESRLRPGPKNTWSLRTSNREARVVLTGIVAQPSFEPTSVAVDHPDLLLGRTFAERLARAGVAVTGHVEPVAPAEISWARTRCVAVTTTPLFKALRRANKRSFNMAAEALFLRAGDGTWDGSAEMMTRTLSATFNLAPRSLAVADGSGLGRGNGVSPTAVTQLLAGAVRGRGAMLLLASLPVGGVDGTLAGRFERPPCRGRVLAKTGTIRGVSTLSGYVLDETRRPRIAFSVLVNRIRGGTAPARRLQEGICRMLIDQIPAPTSRKEAGP